MSLDLHIDNGLAAFGEWDAYVHSGSAVVSQAGEAAFSGALGLKVAQASMDAAYLEKNFTIYVPEDGHFWVGYWLRLIDNHQTTSGLLPCSIDFSVDPGDLRLYIRGDGDPVYKRKAILASYDDAREPKSTGYTVYIPPRWTHIAYHLHRASADDVDDGDIELWVNGQLAGAVNGIANWDGMRRADVLRSGNLSPVDDVLLHIDSMTVADERPVAEVAGGRAVFDAPTRRGGVRRFARHPLA